MSEAAGVFKPLALWCRLRDACTDNSVFRLHYRVTVMILLGFFITITTTQFVGEPVRCIGGGNDKDRDAVNSYCWIYGTYTVKERLKGVTGKHMSHPGVGHLNPGDQALHHRYYQWVYFLLPVQAIFFYAPHLLWKTFEGNKVKGLTEKLNTPLMPEEWTLEKRLKLCRYLININNYTKNIYGFQFAFCELINLVNSVGQIFVLDIFLSGNFKKYGIKFVNYQNGVWDPNMANPMDIVFPKVSKCIFHTHGPSGDIQNHDLMCILPLNVVHEKIFLFLWFWLIILSSISAIAVIYRALVFLCPCVRAYSIMIQAKLVPKYHICNIVSSFSVNDWFLLNQIGKNMNVFAFNELVTLLGEELERVKKVEFV